MLLLLSIIAYKWYLENVSLFWFRNNMFSLRTLQVASNRDLLVLAPETDLLKEPSRLHDDRRAGSTSQLEL